MDQFTGTNKKEEESPCRDPISGFTLRVVGELKVGGKWAYHRNLIHSQNDSNSWVLTVQCKGKDSTQGRSFKTSGAAREMCVDLCSGHWLEQQMDKATGRCTSQTPCHGPQTPYETGVIIIISTLKMRRLRLKSEYDVRIQLRTVGRRLAFKLHLSASRSEVAISNAAAGPQTTPGAAARP